MHAVGHDRVTLKLAARRGIIESPEKKFVVPGLDPGTHVEDKPYFSRG
jgi:hypothetical protein